jgi:peroxiredoxin
MRELREFAQRINDFDQAGVTVVGVSVDDQQGARKAWSDAAQRKVRILSDPERKVIRDYGLVHAGGGLNDDDIAIRATVLLDANGIERWRDVSTSKVDLQTADEVLAEVRKLPK